MRRIFAIAAVGLLLFLLWFLAQVRFSLSGAQDEGPKAEGEVLSFRDLGQAERILIVVTRHGWRREPFERQYQIEGGSSVRFALKELNLTNPNQTVSPKVLIGELTTDEIFGLDAYLLFLRRGFRGGGHGREDVVIGYYRGGRKIGEERFRNTMQVFGDMRWENGKVSRPYDLSVSDFPIEVFREIIPPWIVEQRLKAPNKSPEPTPGTVTARAIEPNSK